MKLNKSPSIKIQSGLQVFQLPVLQDNYIYILHDKDTQKTAVVDPALSEPVNLFLEEKNWKLDFIFNTHHHWDHTGGNVKLKKKWNCPVFGFAEDAHRIPEIDTPLKEGEKFSFGKFPCHILFLPGHTLG
ncbi:MAG: MBL fold metallo-hydrolase, partial [Oligoflexia bacterium]|nr:MBL fold metallo-hydrolase [Oligoflexia bacterium]